MSIPDTMHEVRPGAVIHTARRRARWQAFLTDTSGERFALIGKVWGGVSYDLWGVRYQDGTCHLWQTLEDSRGEYVRAARRPWNREDLT